MNTLRFVAAQAWQEFRAGCRGPLLAIVFPGLIGYALIVILNADYMREMGATEVPRNSPHVIYLMMAGQAVWIFFVWAWLFGLNVVRDRNASLHEVVLSTPVSLPALLFGRYLGRPGSLDPPSGRDGHRLLAGPGARGPGDHPAGCGWAAPLVRDGPFAPAVHPADRGWSRRAFPVRGDPDPKHRRALRGRGHADAGLDGGHGRRSRRRRQPGGRDPARRLRLRRDRGTDEPDDAAREGGRRHRTDAAPARQPPDLDAAAAAPVGDRAAPRRPRTTGAGEGAGYAPAKVASERSASESARVGSSPRPRGHAVLAQGDLDRSGMAPETLVPGLGHATRPRHDGGDRRRRRLRSRRPSRRRSAAAPLRVGRADDHRVLLPRDRLHGGRLRRRHGAPRRPHRLERDQRRDAGAGWHARRRTGAGVALPDGRLRPDSPRGGVDRDRTGASRRLQPRQSGTVLRPAAGARAAGSRRGRAAWRTR